MIMVIWMGMAENENQKLIVVDDLKPAFAPLKTKSNINIRFDYSDMELSEAKKLLYNSDYTGILYIPHNILYCAAFLLKTT